MVGLAAAMAEEANTLIPRRVEFSHSNPASFALLILEIVRVFLARRLLRGRSPAERPRWFPIWTYVSQHRRHCPHLNVQGVLLHPTVHREFAADYAIDGDRIRAATANLKSDWTDIRMQSRSL
jgi:hypothetical protein